MSKKSKKNVEVNVGPQVNCRGPVESIEINDTTKLICNCSKVSIIITRLTLVTKLFVANSEALPSVFRPRCWFRNFPGLSHRQVFLLLLWQCCCWRITNIEICSDWPASHLCHDRSG